MSDSVFACNFGLDSINRMMSVSTIRKSYHQRLSDLYPREEINSLFESAAEYCLGMDRLRLHQNLNKNTSASAEKKMIEVLDRLVLAEPIQYIIGKTGFYNIELRIGPGVLIPRQETEYLTAMIIKENEKCENMRIIDLCTGSGCIAIALAKNLPGSEVWASDTSKTALRLAKKNGELNGQEICWIMDDVLAPEAQYKYFDIIVSNPPYVRNSEKSNMHRNVIDYEPREALFVEDADPLCFYEAIARFSQERLNTPGKLYLEVNQYLAEDTRSLFIANGFQQCEILSDLNNNQRYLRCIQ